MRIMMTNSKYINQWIAGLFTCSLLIAPCLLSSCSEDEGNYDYHDIPEVTVKGVETNYTVMRGTGYVLEIKPEVTTTGNPNDLEYLWMMQTTNSPELNQTYVLGQERDLSWDQPSFSVSLTRRVGSPSPNQRSSPPPPVLATVSC